MQAASFDTIDDGHEPIPLLPERDGEVVITVCQRIGGNLHCEQRKFTHAEVRSAVAFEKMKLELSWMLARLERVPRDKRA